MTKEELIDGLKERVIDSGLQAYIDGFNKAKTNPYLNLYDLNLFSSWCFLNIFTLTASEIILNTRNVMSIMLSW